jgi:hypothetical protein
MAWLLENTLNHIRFEGQMICKNKNSLHNNQPVEIINELLATINNQQARALFNFIITIKHNTMKSNGSSEQSCSMVQRKNNY